ncbi:MAG: site-specific integrase [Deltaproteobacteria bacterium]|jgi:integrase|nr:site-specific integrase [Deltaproteobacteria bacterium]
MFSGLRAGECRRLTWADIDFEHGKIFIKDTKNRFNRNAHITAEIREMLLRRYQGQSKSTKVLLGLEGGESYCPISEHFSRAVKELGLNQGTTERRQTVCFHTLQHTFASWLVIMGKPLYTVSKLLGHNNIRWTERPPGPRSQKSGGREIGRHFESRQ